MHPVGPLTPRTYWIRRVLVIAAAVAVVLGLVWIVANRAGGGTGTGLAADSSSTSSSPAMTGVLASDLESASTTASTSTTASPSGSTSSASTSSGSKTSGSKTSGSKTSATKTSDTESTAKTSDTKTSATTKAGATPKSTDKATSTPSTPSTEKSSTKATPTTKASSTPKSTPAVTTSSSTPPAPSTDAQGRLLCPDSAMKLTGTTGAPTYTSGQQPVLGVTVQNVSSSECVRDLSGPLQVFTVYTKSGDRVWSTADCFPGEGEDIRQMAAGESRQYNIRWSGTTSNPGCTADRVRVPAGEYQLRVEIGSLKASTVDFTIT